MQYDVTIDRDRFIGGSDLGAIMGLSPFKTRWQLLLEKAGLAESDFSGNKYTEFGNELEPVIRDYINQLYFTNFEPNRVIAGAFRAHTDGFNGNAVLEIKTTSNLHDDISDYKLYLVQLVKYMEVNKVEKGILCVYDRPADFDTEFDPERLQIWEIDISEYISLLAEINAEIDRFLSDLERLKENPLLSEEDFQPNELVTLSNKVLSFEKQIAAFKEVEKQYKAMKDELYSAMVKHGVKTWETLNGVKITRVDEVKPTTETVKEFDTAAFAMEHPDLYEDYCKDVVKKKTGRAGYVKITI